MKVCITLTYETAAEHPQDEAQKVVEALFYAGAAQEDGRDFKFEGAALTVNGVPVELEAP